MQRENKWQERFYSRYELHKGTGLPILIRKGMGTGSITDLEDLEDFIQSEIDTAVEKAVADYQTNFEQKHIASAVEVEDR